MSAKLRTMQRVARGPSRPADRLARIHLPGDELAHEHRLVTSWSKQHDVNGQGRLEPGFQRGYEKSVMPLNKRPSEQSVRILYTVH
jgi:hypothetical protein